jgi:large subunit ribosomal protein L13
MRAFNMYYNMQSMSFCCRGKHMATYSPSMDMGAYVVVINADKVTVTGNKPNAKTYFRHVNGRPGSWKIETFNQLQKVRR